MSHLRDTMRSGRPLTRSQVFDLARQDRLSGAVVFHFRDGLARKIEVTTPLQAEVAGEEQASAPEYDGIKVRPPLTSR